MRLLFPIGAAVAALAVTVSAQDTTVKTRTQIEADDAKVMSMTGCLRHDAATDTYSLIGAIASSATGLSTRTETRTEVEKDEVNVETRSKTKAEDGAVGTSGVISTYALVPRSGVELKAHAGKRVQISALKIERGEGDAEVTVREKTTTEREDARDTSTRSKTTVEVPRSPGGAYTVVSVKEMAGTCS
jgi:hypothetical protein